MKAIYYEYNEDGETQLKIECDVNICFGESPPLLNIELPQNIKKNKYYKAVDIKLGSLIGEFFSGFIEYFKKRTVLS